MQVNILMSLNTILATKLYSLYKLPTQLLTIILFTCQDYLWLLGLGCDSLVS